MNNNSSHDDSSSDSIMCTIRGMRQRERQYVPRDYLRHPQQQHSCNVSPSEGECRAKMSLWCAQIIDHCNFQRETSAIAMNFLDRFLSVTPWALEDRSAFQLAAITSLYTAIKVHEPQAIAIVSMAGLTRGVFTVEQIEAMERIMLEANRWLVHPPTTFAYGHLFCEIIALSDPDYDFQTMHELTRLQLEASVHNYDIALSLPSEVAFAAVMNAAEGMAVASPVALQDIEALLSSATKIDASSSSIHSIERTLYEGIIGVGASAEVVAQDSSSAKRYCQHPMSPRSVSAMKSHNC